MGISDTIANFIDEVLSAEEGSTEFSRIALASRFGCVPSQINYVLSTRFSPERGYMIESRRGGGGYIRISRVTISPADVIMHAVNSIGNELDVPTARAIMKNLMNCGVAEAREVRIIDAAISEASLAEAIPQLRPAIRADIFKRCLLALAKQH